MRQYFPSMLPMQLRILSILLLLLLTTTALSPGGSVYFTCIQNMKLVTNKFKSRGLHEKHVVATWNPGNHLSISLNSSPIRSHISEVRTVLYILVAVPFKWLLRTRVQCPVLFSFQLEKKYPKDESNSPLARYLNQTFFLRLPEM